MIMKRKTMKQRVNETKICLCRDTMIKLFKHLRKTKSGISLMKLITKRTANQFPMRKPRLMRKKPKTDNRETMMAERNRLWKIKEANRPRLRESKSSSRSKLFKKTNNALVDLDKKLYGRSSYQKVGIRKKPRTALQKAATRKLVAFNKKRFR